MQYATVHLKEGKKTWICTQTFVYKWNLSSITKKLVLDFELLFRLWKAWKKSTLPFVIAKAWKMCRITAFREHIGEPSSQGNKVGWSKGRAGALSESQVTGTSSWARHSQMPDKPRGNAQLMFSVNCWKAWGYNVWVAIDKMEIHNHWCSQVRSEQDFFKAQAWGRDKLFASHRQSSKRNI